MTLIYTTGSQTGTAGNDYIVGQTNGSGSNFIEGGDGNDVIHGDFGAFINGPGSNTAAGAFTLTAFPSIWSRTDDPDFGNSTIPHTTVYVDTNAQNSYWAITVTAGQTITADLDYGAGAMTNSWIGMSLVGPDQSTVLVNNTGAPTSLGGNGSVLSLDSYFTYTFTTAGTYYIRLSEVPVWPLGTGPFEGALNISLTGQVTGPAVIEGNDTLYGGNGDDTIYGGGGNDHIAGGAGVNYLYGGAGDDWISSIYGGADHVYGGSGNDTFLMNAEAEVQGGAGNDWMEISGNAVGFSLDGNAGIDTLVVTRNWNSLVVIDLEAGTAQTVGRSITTTHFTFGGIEDYFNRATAGGAEAVLGTAGQNRITTGAGGNYIEGRGGADTIVSGAGNDKVYGGAGNDVLYGGDGDDLLDGGDASDTLIGWAGNDQIYGGNGTDVLVGGDGDDNLDGGTSGDLLTGGDGNDLLWGGAGSDTLIGGSGDDLLHGGSQADFFQFGLGSDQDLVADFQVGIDTIQLWNTLWDQQDLTTAQIVALGSFDATHTTFTWDFGDGDILTLQSSTAFTAANLAAQIDILVPLPF